MSDLISRQDAIDSISAKLDKSTKGDVGSFYNTILKNAIESVKCVPSAQQWIPCSERLPNDDGNYIVTLSYTEGFKFSFVDIDNFSVYEHQWGVYGNDVIAWSPLPEPWRGETDEQIH